jgi:hypothetical protein
MRFILGVLIAGLLATSAAAQPWYARGEFNGWTQDNPMTDEGGGHWTADIGPLFDNQPYNWKIACCGGDGWAINMPSSDARVHTDALGEIHLHLYDQTSWSDGWFPDNVRRVGYEDHQQFDWEIVGTFNAWAAAFDPAYALTDMGNGLHRGTFPMTAGFHEFKFRGLVDQTVPPPNGYWDTSIGANFGLGAANNLFAVANEGDLWTFELDLPNGRLRYFAEESPELEGDHNGDGAVGAEDYVWWRKNDAGNPAGYTAFRTNFGRTGAGGGHSWIARSPTAGDETMTDLGGGEFDRVETELTAGTDYDFQVVRSDAAEIVPASSHMRVRANADGDIDLNFYELDGESWGDGWSPDATSRVGYEDTQQHDWEIMGSFNGWSTPVVALTDEGEGLHTATYTVAAAGTYSFKFRAASLLPDPWAISIGQDFGTFAPDANITTTNPNELWHFELDLPNGRWRAYLDGSGGGAAVPEPSSVALLMLGAVWMLSVRRK